MHVCMHMCAYVCSNSSTYVRMNVFMCAITVVLSPHLLVVIIKHTYIHTNYYTYNVCIYKSPRKHSFSWAPGINECM